MGKSKIKYHGLIRHYLNAPLYLGILPVGAAAALFCFSWEAGIAMAVSACIYLVVVIVCMALVKPKLGRELVNFATQYGTVQKKLLREFKIPYALLDVRGRILWSNEAFQKLTEIDPAGHSLIKTVFPALTDDIVTASHDDMNVVLEWKDMYLTAVLKKIGFTEILGDSKILEDVQKDDSLTALYIFDDTKLNRYIKANEEQRMVVAHIYIDNYDEALDSVEYVKRSMLVALIDRKVNNYFSNVDALISKIENDKYFVVFKHKFMRTLEENKFNILDEVKTIKVGNSMPVTLSVGIGDCGDGYIENNEFARAAIDLALGRGGDQVVVREGEKIRYFGGKSEQVEKTTRVKARVKAQALRSIMENHDRVLVMGHQISDVDAFGSALGIFVAAREIDKKAQIVLNTITSSLRPVVDMFTTDKGYPADMFLTSEQAVEVCDSDTVVVVVDTNKSTNVECPEILKKTREIVVFDHHRQSSEIIENPLLSYVEPYASSACEMIAEVLQYFSEKIKLAPAEADAIYAGIIIDTNNFMAKAGVRTFEAAAYLRRNGADVTRVRKILRNDLADYKARADVVRQAEVYRDKFAISTFLATDVESPTVMGAQAANELLNIIGISASFVLTPFNGKIYVSARSIDDINVQLIMESLGGGGHMNIAGAQLEEISLDDAKQIVKDTIDEMIESGDIS